jgi:hypothetical protein
VPDRWKARVDAILYPTCPVNLKDRKSATQLNETSQECPCGTGDKTDEDKKVD